MLCHAARYATFLPGLDTFRASGALGGGDADADERAVARAVVDSVIAPGVDADHVMIQALSTALRVPLGVVYAVGEAHAQVRAVLQ